MKTKYLVTSLLLPVIGLMLLACSSINKYDDIESWELYRIQVGGKYGFINEHGNIVIEPQFDRAYWYFGDGVCYAEIGGQKGLINTDGEFVLYLDNTFSWVRQFQNGIATFNDNNNKIGVIEKSGEIILPAIYKNIARDESYGLIIEDTLGNCGYVNNKGQLIVPCKYDAVNGFHEGLMVVATSDKCGYVDTAGVWVLDAIYDDARGFGEGYARVKMNGKWSFIDHNGNIVPNMCYDEILTGFSCNRAFVKNKNEIEMIDKRGTRITEIEADSVCEFHEGFATFKKNGKYGKLDTNGRVVIQPKYKKLYATNRGLAIFEENNKQGLIDTAENVIVKALHEEFFNKSEFSLLQFEDDNWRRGIYYDRRGNLIWKDMKNSSYLSDKPTKSDFVDYFDSRLSELDPIEGIYYVSFNGLVEDRDNGRISSYGSSSDFYAVIREPNTDDFIAWVVDESKPWTHWVKKFVQIGETNTYAVVNNGDHTSWAEDGKLILENPYKFDVTLRQKGNNYYNMYVQCEFIKDHPSSDAYEQVQQAEWSGTCFAIADGYVVTNYHITNGAKTIKVRGVNGGMKNAYKAYVVASDRNHDLAILKIVDKGFHSFDEIPYCIGKSIPEVGDDVFVLGYPMTKTMGQEIKLTNGIISSASGFKGDQSMYQISAAIQPGNSGGPLFDNEGNVIGVVCAKHAEAENANYAIKVSYLYSLVNGSGLGIKISDGNKVKSKSLSKKVKQVKPFVYLIECSTH